MADVCDDDADIPLKDGLDIDDLRQGEGQLFEVDEDRMINTGKCAQARGLHSYAAHQPCLNKHGWLLIQAKKRAELKVCQAKPIIGKNTRICES
jgi:hypothetical protein